MSSTIAKPGGDPEDMLARLHEQLDWMRTAGLVRLECYWRSRGFALLIGDAATR